MRVWMSENTEKSDRYAGRVIFSIIGITLLVVALSVASVFLVLHFSLPMEAFSLAFCLLVTAVAVWCALRAGKSSVRDALIFCRDDADNLFVVDVRNFVRYRRGKAGAVAMAVKTGQLQKKLKEEHILERRMQDGSLKNHVPQILSVETVTAKPDGYAIVCMVRYPRGNVSRARYFLRHEYAHEDELIFALERKTCIAPRSCN